MNNNTNTHGLNQAQLEATETTKGPVLVIAGAGSGKTRTIVYRLAKLISSGVSPASILLLTFTRKASQEMLDRATKLLGFTGMPELYSGNQQEQTNNINNSILNQPLNNINIGAIQGGTFHAFAFSILRQHRPSGYQNAPSIMDTSDSIAALQHCREHLKVAKGERGFPKNQTILGLFSKSRNKELGLEETIRRDAYHLLAYADELEKLLSAYAEFKRSHGLMDYDDLLFELERLFIENTALLESYRARFSYIMVDEYQDTNLVQCRLVRALAGETGNILAVGDDAQSIYAFRGANVKNILGFTEHFPQAKIIKLEENYRSTQDILNLCNSILDYATENYKKNLFTKRIDSSKPQIIRPFSDLTQAKLVATRISQLLDKYPAHEIAVLFRSGYHSYHLEVALNKMGIKFRKYGGIRYTEAQHIKDVISYARLLINPLDFTAFQRMAALSKGIGTKTCLKIYQALQSGDQKEINKACVKFDSLGQDLKLLEKLRAQNQNPAAIIDQLAEHYRPYLEAHFTDDYPRRLQGLEELVQIAASYTDLDLFIADLCLDDPFNNPDQENDERIVLSTIHSSKGLEWSAVLIIDLVEERFPSRMAMLKADDFEEERRLMYVACTRAKDELYLFAPATLYDRASGGSNHAQASPFIREFVPDLYDEWQENYAGQLTQKERYQAPKMRTVVQHNSLGHSSAQSSGHSFGHSSGQSSAQSSAQSSGQSFNTSQALKAPSKTTQEADLGSQSDNFSPKEQGAARLGFCTHRIFGRGKITEELPPDKYRVNFQGFGLKVILAEYLKLED